jgi:energy-coupling factor transporter ATP-binding protein EcfA2
MIEVTGLHYTYPGMDHPALSDLSLQIPEGQFVSIVGANGSGKSTLCYALAGFIPSFFRGRVQGQVRVGGIDPLSGGPSAVAGRVGLVFQDPFSQITGARFSVEEEIAFGLENLGVDREEMRARVDEALRLVGLSALSDRSPYELSGGEQQRLALASILALRPRVLVLDEPTSQLDPQGARQVIEAVDRLTAERNATVVLVEHRLEWIAAHADRTVILHEGRLVADGPPAEILTQPEVEGFGLRRTRYSQAAEAARLRGWLPAHQPLPATLPQAIGCFR